jgi:hypothetical protein
LFATIAELIGDKVKPGEGIDSYSFRKNILDIKAKQVRKTVILSGGASGAFIAIKNNWKFIEAAVPGRWPETYYPNGPSKLEPQLYYLAVDKSEQHNLYSKNQKKVAELKSIIEKVKANPNTEDK